MTGNLPPVPLTTLTASVLHAKVPSHPEDSRFLGWCDACQPASLDLSTSRLPAWPNSWALSSSIDGFTIDKSYEGD